MSLQHRSLWRPGGFRPKERAVFLALLALVLGLVGLKAARTFYGELHDYFPRHGPVPLPTPVPQGMKEVAFPSADGTPLRGWMLPSRNGAAVIFIHGSAADRRALLPE